VAEYSRAIQMDRDPKRSEEMKRKMSEIENAK
jgi:hypothetical protein